MKHNNSLFKFFIAINVELNLFEFHNYEKFNNQKTVVI